MVIVDDHLTLLVLAGAVVPVDFNDDVATTSLWYLRLVSAATAPSSDAHGPGRLGRLLASLPDRDAALERILHPPRTMLEVLHPMAFAVETARVQREQRLNLLAAETLGAGAHHGASIQVASPNAGGPIERAALAEGISYEVRSS
jgi:predicted component of type VI protein secretion system